MRRLASERRAWAAGLLLLAALLPACDDDEDGPFDFSLTWSITFVADDPDPGPLSLTLQPYEYGGSSGVDVGIHVSDVTALREVSYTLVYDPTVTSFAFAGVGGHFGSEAGSSLLEAALEDGRQGRLRVRHRVAEDRAAVSGSGVPHFLSFDFCLGAPGCREVGETGLFLEGLQLLDDDGRPIAVASAGGRIVVSR